MRLARFLETDREAILSAASAYARTIPALASTDEETLRDHLPHLLESISADLRTTQTRQQSIEKSHGDAPEGGAVTSAQVHGLLRARRGISIEQLVAEFRALRSSILRLWMDKADVDGESVEDIIRFNEAIDQAVAESVQYYAQERERWRQIFLGVLGHDLRGPLSSIALTIEVMRRAGTAPTHQTALLSRAVKRLTSLLDSLLEYNRAGFGAGMQLQRRATDLRAACAEELELLRAAHPDAQIQLTADDAVHADVDASRVREALSNLVSNAVKHGKAGQPVIVTLAGDASVARVSVKNAGDIPAGEMESLFEPLRQRDSPSVRTERTHLGLGLFIARQIARAHGGDVVGASGNGTVAFTIHLPKAVTAPRQDG
ncbi:sensor histidine kinase KdpD [Acidovorax sp. Leaf160]|uniref:sensor histidine kinase n=1 Tax=Acidovorax sp. Leaf160 TaxID=1736280 RepID=UPI0006F8B22D|nr:HAMP domain-containing sensor histidine kinase [Acidovorax sp. Leaf160]KQR41438.1 hypothetical protein ASF94_13210 [Acidovorax sp. Leaf160]